jgi:CheY-like chemotaxis protein
MFSQTNAIQLKVMSHSESQTTSSSPPTILVIDDDWDVQDALSETLQDAGYQVTCAANGEEALRHLNQNPAPDAILLDLFMPVMNGWDTARAIQRRGDLSSIPLIVITASEPYWGYPTGQVLRKPIERDKLIGAVHHVIRTRTARTPTPTPIPPPANNRVS